MREDRDGHAYGAPVVTLMALNWITNADWINAEEHQA